MVAYQSKGRFIIPLVWTFIEVNVQTIQQTILSKIISIPINDTSKSSENKSLISFNFHSWAYQNITVARKCPNQPKPLSITWL